MFISFCKVFIDENMFRDIFINIVSGSSRDTPNNNVGGLVCF